MMGDGLFAQNTSNSINNCHKNKSKKKKKKRGGAKKKMTAEQTLALKSVNEWVYLDTSLFNSSSSSDDEVNDFIPRMATYPRASDKVSIELHCHSICSDGFLSPRALVEKAHQNGVKVLALTDHDTMSGIPEALEVARRYGIKIIPGVEISTIFSLREDLASEEPVHILAYYSGCGPTRLKMPLKWEHVTKIAGSGVAPGRLHVARALVEAGHVENLKQAFTRYLYDGGPAYSKGSEPSAEEAVQLICETGGLAVLAHPWALKNPIPIIKRLKEAGLHGIEVYRSDGKLAVYSDLADAYGLVKLGGSDYHGRGGHNESPLGSVSLPVLATHDFLKVARPIWCTAIREILERYAEDPSVSNLEQITRFQKTRVSKETTGKDLINLCLSSWLTKEEVQTTEFHATVSKLSHILRN
ncbi:hypothetical protein Ancab_017408 [Ancistrocladus abbreviatus]